MDDGFVLEPSEPLKGHPMDVQASQDKESVLGRTAGQTASKPEGWTPRLCFGMLAIALVAEAVSMSYLMLSTALPFVAEHYRTTQSAWILTAMLITGAMCAPLVGKLADMYGKRLLLIICTASGCIGFLVSAIAPNYAVMLTGRALTGLLSSSVFLGYSLIRDVFPKKIVPMAVSLAMVGMGVVAVPAPFLTGYLLDNFGFRSIFWFFVVLLAATAVLMLTLEESKVRVRSSIDFVGAGLLGLGIAGVLIAVSLGPSWGWTAVSTLAYLFGGIVLLILWGITANMKTDPLIDLKLVSRRPVMFTTLCTGMVFGVAAMFSTLMPIMVMAPEMMGLGYGWGFSAEQYAVFLVPFVGAMLVGGLAVGSLVARGVKPKVLMVSGLVLFAVGMTLLALNHSDVTTMMWILPVVGLAQGVGTASIPNLLIESVAPELQASTSSITMVAQNVFPAVTTVVAFSILNNSHVATVLEGVPFYSTGGFKAVFLVGAVVAVAGAVCGCALPRNIVQQRLDPMADAFAEPARAS